VSTAHSERLYYADSYLTRFEARVVERLTWEDQPALVLDRTAFYPTSGGQPSDRGTLCDVPVVGVEVREPDGAVVHLLRKDLAVDRVVGQVDWARRFDHMQQHSGQHLLSAACEQLLDAHTVSFHLGADVCTIDLDVARLSPEALEPAEELVNRVIWENRAVSIRSAPAEELTGVRTRPGRSLEGPIRLVEIGAGQDTTPFDLNPCGGTHVARTGEIGLLKVIRLDYRGQETRVEFLCGGRALHDYGTKNRTLLDLAAMMTVGYWELADAVARLEEELKAARRDLRAAREKALEEEAARLVQAAGSADPLRVVWAVWEGRDPAELRALVQKVAAHPDTIVLLASLGERGHLCVARAEGVEADAAELLRAAMDPLEGRGGGQAGLAQGSTPVTDRARVEEALAKVVSALGSRPAGS
jgi:alanyl-tRNA synthetase